MNLSRRRLVSLFVYGGVAFALIGSGLIPTFVSPQINITDVTYEENAEIEEYDYTTYYSQLSDAEQEALESGQASNDLQEYVEAQGVTAGGKVITNSGVYVIYGEAEYGMYTPFVRYGLVGFFPGVVVIVYSIVRGQKSKDDGETVES